MQNKLKTFIAVVVFLMSSYSASVYSAALTQATDNSFAPGGSANDVTLLQDSLITIQGFNEWARLEHNFVRKSVAIRTLENEGPFAAFAAAWLYGMTGDDEDEEEDDLWYRYEYEYLDAQYEQYKRREFLHGRQDEAISRSEFMYRFSPASYSYRSLDGGTIDTQDPADYEGYALNGQARRKMIRLSDLFDVNEYSSADNHGEGTAKPAQASSPWDNMFVFGSGGYRHQDVDSVGTTPGSETESFQGSIGIATMLSTELTSGVSLTIADSDSEADTTTFNTGTFVPFESDARSATFSLFTTFSDLEGYNFSGAYSYTHTSTDMIRRTAFNDIGGGGDLFVQADADDVDSGTHNFSLSGSYTRFEGSGWMWGPNASLSFGFGETDGYTEAGGGTNVNLSVGESEYSFWSFTAGVHGSKYFKLSNNAKQKTLLNFGANWVHTDSETDNDVLITQVDTGVTTTRLAGTEAANKPGDDYLQLSLGLNHNVGDRTRLGLSHSMELLRDNSFAYFFGLNFSHVWD
jgi:hypothetical protein